jgi:DNA-binding GntR family transcriptional regulator
MIAEIPTSLRLGVSRLPVREATSILEREGLLVLEGRGRRRVRSLEPQDLREILDIRLVLEPKLSGLAAEFRAQEDLEALEANLEKLKKTSRLSQVSILDLEFHELIATASRHSRLAHMWRVMRGQIQLFTAEVQRRQQSKAQSVRDGTAKNHATILKFIRLQDAQGVAAFIATELQNWKEYLGSLLPAEATG